MQRNIGGGRRGRPPARGPGWHLLTKDVDYLSARLALVARKVRGMEIACGQPGG
jgi:hypothetical protein